jgi:hypothetical protein
MGMSGFMDQSWFSIFSCANPGIHSAPFCNWVPA